MRIRVPILLVLLLQAVAVQGDTTHIRELAKNDTPVRIVALGSSALEAAEELRGEIVRHPEWKRGKPANSLRVTGMLDAEAAARDPRFIESSLVFVVATREPERISASLAGLMPARVSDLGPGEGLAHSVMTRPKPLAYSVLLAAPDLPRLRAVLQRFVERSAGDYRDLGFTERFFTNRLAVITDSPESVPDGWGTRAGRNVWNDVKRYSTAGREKLTAAELEERNEAYFIDRSLNGRIPPGARRALQGLTVRPGTILVARDTAEDGRKVVILSAPNARLLRRLTARVRTLADVQPEVKEAVDLRQVAAAAILIHGHTGSADPTDIESIRYRLASDMRRILGLEVREFGRAWESAQEAALAADLTGVKELAARAAAGDDLKYAWLFQMGESRGSTDYRADFQRLTRDPAPYEAVVPPPSKPKKDEGEREKAIYDSRLAQWKLDKESYVRFMSREAPVDWRENVERMSTATVRGVLRLMDLRNGEVLWERNCDAADKETTLFRSRDMTLRGYAARPPEANVPSREERASRPLMSSAALLAGRRAIDALEEEAWLPGDDTSAGSAAAKR